jgi:hypothetical protein
VVAIGFQVPEPITTSDGAQQSNHRAVPTLKPLMSLPLAPL